jgi:drug/metabolite transporter (DMT)-like permease
MMLRPIRRVQQMRAAFPGWLSPALLSPIFLGMAPVLGKAAIMGGSEAFTVAAVRTVLAAVILWVVYLAFARQYIFIFPAGLLGCVVVGTVNGIGSLMYYGGLATLKNASVAQLLNSSYLVFVVILARFSGQPLTRRTLTRVGLTMIAILFLTGGFQGGADWFGIGLMIGNAILFAGTVVLSQRVLYEMPSPTVTLYVMTTMAVVVVMARAIYRLEWLPPQPEALLPIFALGVTTALSRLTLFAGVKKMGSLQTVLIGILESVVALGLSFVFFGERFTPIQVAAIVILLTSLFLVRGDDLEQQHMQAIPVLSLGGLSSGREIDAFIAAFGKPMVRELPIKPSKQLGVYKAVSPNDLEKKAKTKS